MRMRREVGLGASSSYLNLPPPPPPHPPYSTSSSVLLPPPYSTSSDSLPTSSSLPHLLLQPHPRPSPGAPQEEGGAPVGQAQA
eukprot:3227777-Pyramimonas_sp.AAC.2